MIGLQLPFSRARVGSIRTISAIPSYGGLMSGAHVLIKGICFVHLVGLCLLCVQPPLQELGIVLLKVLITLFDLSKFQLECTDFIVKNLATK